MMKKRELIPDIYMEKEPDYASIIDEDDDDGIPTKIDPYVAKITGTTQEDFDNV